MSSLILPAGFRFAGTACGIKASGKPDLSLIVGEEDLVAAGVYTRNQIVAAPVLVCRDRTPGTGIRAVVTNSGNANACTGEQGRRDADQMCRLVAEANSISEQDVLVMSTGIIGVPLPMQRIESGIGEATSKLGETAADFRAAAEAILTTDDACKIASGTVTLSGQPVRIAAMAKGAGMIAPNMATMLCVVMTDAALNAEQAQSLLGRAVDESFNRVSVDGHMSTNDTVLLLASGASNAEVSDRDATSFAAELTRICTELAVALVADGEGAQRVMKIRVFGAESDGDADQIARAVGESPLVKTAITGGDPNWGRIVSAAGYAGPKINPDRTELTLCGEMIYSGGVPKPFDEADLSRKMLADKIVDIDLQVGDGDGQATRWASDLTVEYVRFNSEYTT